MHTFKNEEWRYFVPIIEKSAGDGRSRPCTVTGPSTDLWARACTSLHTMNWQRQRRKRGILVKCSAFFVIVGVLSPLCDYMTQVRLSFLVPLMEKRSARNLVDFGGLGSSNNTGFTSLAHDEMTSGNINHDNSFSGVKARGFEPWPADTPLPCFLPEPDWQMPTVQSTPSRVGFLYLKPFKTGSSTAAGIHLRISRNVARRKQQHLPAAALPESQMNAPPSDPMCRARFGHGPQPFPALMLFANRTKRTSTTHNNDSSYSSFLWTMIREPSQRVVSEFYHFYVSRKKKEPTVSNFRTFLFDYETHRKRDYYLKSLSMRQAFDRDLLQQYDPIAEANAILGDYDFIGITERMDESAVVLMMLLGLPMADVLFVTAKTHGGFDDAGGAANGKCTYIWPSFISPGMQQVLQSEDWQDHVKYDRALYQAANRSLDLTMDLLGRDRVSANMARYRRAKELIAAKCLPIVGFPCDMNGVRQNDTDCLWKDSGCGTTCLDEVATAFSLC
jgi:hypothetical protein